MATALFPGALWRGEVFYLNDLQAYHRPQRAVLVRLIHETPGLPLWNPLRADGQPFAANPANSLFHPLTTLFFVLPLVPAFNLQVILPPLASVGTFAFLLWALGLRRRSCLFGGLTFGLGGYALSVTQMHPIPAAVAALPAVLGLIVRLGASGGDRLLVAGLALAFGLEALAAEPSTLVATALLIPAAFAAGRRLAPAGPRTARALSTVAAGLVLGLAVGAVALLPALDLGRRSIRAEGVSARAAERWTLPPVRCLEALSPYVLGHVEDPDERWYWGSALYPRSTGRPYVFSLYPGLLASVLAAVAAWMRARALWPWLLTAVGGFLLALGDRFVVWPLARMAPPFNLLRFPEKFTLVAVVAGCVCAAAGFDLLLREPVRARRLAARALAVIACGALVVAGLAVAADRYGWIPEPATFIQADPAIWPSLAVILQRDFLRVAAVAASGLVALLLFARAGERTGAAALLLAAAADLTLAGRPLVPTRPASVSPLPLLAPLLDPPIRGPLFHRASWAGLTQFPLGLADPPVPAEWGIATTLERDFELTQLAWSRRATAFFLVEVNDHPGMLEPLLERRGVGAVADLAPLPIDDGTSPLRLWRPARSRGFAFLAERVEVIPDADAWGEAVHRLGAMAGGAALVEEEQAAGVPRAPSAGTVAAITEDASPVARAFAVDVAGPGDGFLAINQTWDAGWTARVDGAPVRLVRTDLALSGVVVPPGRHRVDLSYRDRAVDAGTAVSLAGLVAVALLVLVRRPAAAG